MYLSDRDLAHAIRRNHLIVEPPPAKIDPTAIDLRLDDPGQAKVWDIARLKDTDEIMGAGEEDDVIARLIVAQLSSVPDVTQEAAGSATQGQGDVTGATAG